MSVRRFSPPSSHDEVAPPSQPIHLSSSSKSRPVPVGREPKSINLDPSKEKVWMERDGKYAAFQNRLVDTLPASEYITRYNEEMGVHLDIHHSNTDELIEMPDSVSEEVVTEIEYFWNSEEKFREFNFLWKRGVLLWGPPGSGKTSTVHSIIEKIVKRGGVAVHSKEPSLALLALQMFRSVEPKRPLVVVFEDIDAIIKREGEADMLHLLDGETQIDNVVFVATTNYPERLDKRIINRPSRFDIVKRIGMPNKKARELFLKAKNPKLADDESLLKKWVDNSEGFSIAHLKEMIVSVEVFNKPLWEVVARLQKMVESELDSSYNENSTGIGFE